MSCGRTLMDVSSESAKPSWADNKRARLFASYLPIALAAAGCAAAIWIILQTHDLSNERSVWERDASLREQLKAEGSTIDQKLADRRRELDSLEARLKDLRQNASTAQSGLDKALADKGKTEAERMATQTQLDSLRQQIEEGQKKLSGIKDDLTRNGDQQGKLQLSIQQSTSDQAHLQGEVRQLDASLKSMTQQKDALTQQRDALVTEIDGGQTRLRQLKQDVAGQQAEVDRLKKQVDDLRKEWTSLSPVVLDLQGKANNLKPLADQAAQLERNVADLRSRVADLDAQRQAIDLSIKGLQQQKDDAAKNLKTERDDLDAAKNQLARTTEQLRGLEGGREELRALQAQREELERTITERRKSLELLLRPAPPSDLAPMQSAAPDQPPPAGR